MASRQSIHRPPHAQVVAHLLQSGKQALHDGLVDRAADYFRDVVRLDPLSTAGWRGLAATQSGARREICLRWASYADSVVRATIPITSRPPTRAPSWRGSRMLVSGSAAAGLLLFALAGSDLAYRNRMLPGVVAGGIDLGNLSRAAAIERLAVEQRRLESRHLLLDAGTRAWRVRAGDLLRDSSRKIVADAFAFGHEWSLTSRAESRLRAALGYEYHVNLIELNSSAIDQVAAAIAAAIRQERRDAELLHTAQGWIVREDQTGVALDRAAAIAAIAEALHASSNSEASTPIRVDLPVIHESPRRTAAELAPLRQALESLRSLPLVLQAGDRGWTLDRSLLVRIDQAMGAMNLPPDESGISRYLAGLAAEIDVAPQQSHLVREGDRVRDFVFGQAGIELDQRAATQLVADAIRRGEASVELPLREVAPPPGEIEQLGIIAEIGRGDSQFASYSSPERDANVVAGGRDVDGVLIAPGEVFSFNSAVGAITVDKGYQWGEMIEAGSVVPALGGGICQVSTTVFRAAFWSGLEIVERHPHSWRLAWYEADSPPGMDATIALGGPDLRFRNNTGHHILIRVETDLQQKRQTVRLYGTPDGRTVAMQPFVAGAIGIYRQVRQGDMSLAEETFMSYYTQ